MGTEEPALPGAPRTHTAGAPLAVTPAACPRLQTLTLCPGASVQGQAPPGATAFHPAQGLCRGTVFQGAPSWGAVCSSLSPSDSLCLQPVGRAQDTIRGTGPRAHVRGGGDMSRGLSEGQLLPTHGHSPPQTRQQVGGAIPASCLLMAGTQPGHQNQAGPEACGFHVDGAGLHFGRPTRCPNTLPAGTTVPLRGLPQPQALMESIPPSHH